MVYAMTEPHRHAAKFTDNGRPVVINLDLSRIATDEQVITREDWAAIPDLLGWDVCEKNWRCGGPEHTQEFVRRNGTWRLVAANGQIVRNLYPTEAAICDLAIPLLTARDSRVPEVGQ